MINFQCLKKETENKERGFVLSRNLLVKKIQEVVRERRVNPFYHIML